jgi:translocator protein
VQHGDGNRCRRVDAWASFFAMTHPAAPRWAQPWQAPLVAAVWAVSVAALGSLFTELGPWYAGLRQPSWKPPDAWFGPAWTLIFTFTAIAGLQAWRGSTTARQRRELLLAFGVNSLLQVGWSVLFFWLRRPDWALIEVFVLWASIGWLIIVTGRVTRRAAMWLLPYLAWVTFAASINSWVVRLNGPF